MYLLHGNELVNIYKTISINEIITFKSFFNCSNIFKSRYTFHAINFFGKRHQTLKQKVKIIVRLLLFM